MDFFGFGEGSRQLAVNGDKEEKVEDEVDTAMTNGHVSNGHIELEPDQNEESETKCIVNTFKQ